ncbi:MAG: hypothetical protein C5B57_11260 [Blastocatellia bacterium]|nr:MAG: hypothetical protein C5B57_11260 [Blastocatellia bacterium]
MPSRRDSSRFPVVLLLFTQSLVLAGTPHAQGTSAREATLEPPHIAYADGTVKLERDGQLETAAVNTPIIDGDRLTTTSGRIEVLFPDRTTLDLDEFSTIDFLSPTLLRLEAGRVALTVGGANDTRTAVRYEIDTPVASARTESPGDFRVAARAGRDGEETELAVIRGFATLTTEQSSTSVSAGGRSVAFDNGAPSSTERFNSAQSDAFDRWIADRRDARLQTTSAQYLPGDLRMYGGTLDRYGSWQYAEPYGYVWYPTVAPNWQPYYYGYWSPIPRYGWTWIGLDVWSWPTHHYGRWGYGRGSWFWIPGRSWAPAWVSWGAASDYVSWCPLGFDGHPVFNLSLGVGGIGNHGSGWVVVPRGSFGFRGYYVNRYAIPPHLIPRSAGFVAQSTPPVAVPRSVARANVVAAPQTPGRSPSRSADRFPVSASRGNVRVPDREHAGDISGRVPRVDQGRTGSTEPGALAIRRAGPTGTLSGRDSRQRSPDARRVDAPTVDRALPSTPALSTVPHYRGWPENSQAGAGGSTQQATQRWTPSQREPVQPRVTVVPAPRSPGVPQLPGVPTDPAQRSMAIQRPDRAASSNGGAIAAPRAQQNPPPPASAAPERAVPRSGPAAAAPGDQGHAQPAESRGGSAGGPYGGRRR